MEDTGYVMDPESSYHNLIAAKDRITGKTIVFTHGREAVCMETGGERAYYRTDEKRSVEAILDGQGRIKAEIGYGYFGETEDPEALTTGGNPFGYTGYAYEESTGLYDAKARHYDAENGRFVSRDSYEGMINRASSGNRYTYAENNPVRYVDPDGRLPLAAAIAATEVVLLVVAMMATVKIIEMAYEDFQTKKGREALRNADKVIFRGEQYTPKQFEKQAASLGEMLLEGGKKIGKALWDAIKDFVNSVGKEKLKKVTLVSSEGKGQTGGNKGGSNKKPTPEIIAGIVSQIPNSLKQLGKCDQFARAFVQKLKSAGIVYEIIRVESTYGIYSDKAGKNIGQGYHYGIRIGNIIYDNLTTVGLEFGKWLADLGADGSFADITWKIVNEILSR